MTVLIYALGGGWGHLTRAASLARAAAVRNPIRILTNSPYAMRVAKATPELDLIVLDSSLDLERTRARAIREIEAADCDCLVVDTFPRGLGGELAGLLGTLKVTKVLINRDLNPRYVAEAGLRDFVRSTYDLVLIPGAGEAGVFADLPNAVVTNPWLIRAPQPHCGRDGRRIFVCASGETAELPWYGAVVSLLHPTVEVRCVAPTCPSGCPCECWVEHWPAADLYSTVDVVIGGAGYNTVHECAAWQIPLIAHPWRRKYDRQWLRAKRGGVTIARTPQEAAEAAIRQLNQMPLHRPIEFKDGAAEALALIERQLEGTIRGPDSYRCS